MKNTIVLIIFGFIGFGNSFSQEKKFRIDVDWNSKFSFDTIEFQVAGYLYLTQKCTKNAPEVLSNETIKFSNFYVRNIPFSLYLFFEDTIIKKGLYFHKGRDRDSIFKLFGLDRESFRQVDKHSYIYFGEKENVRITCWYDRKKFFYQEEMIGPYIEPIYEEEEE